MRRRARCLHCRYLFYPDPRCKNPKACSDPECQRKRRNASHKQWRDADPEVLSDRRATSRAWRRAHRGHKRAYRNDHPEYVEKNRRMQLAKRVIGRVVVSISISPQLVDKYRELARPLPVVVSTSIANGPRPLLSGAP